MHARGLPTARIQPYLAMAVRLDVAFHIGLLRRHPEGPAFAGMDFAAHSPACTYPCQRFTPDLMIAGACLGVGVGSDSFTVRLSHPQHPAVSTGA